MPPETCNICLGSAFTPGPAGRLSTTGKPPACARCGSLERHRSLRALFERLPIGALSWRRGLQFSPDPAIRNGWFRSYEVSVFGGDNSLDLQAIARPGESYDFVSLNHVIEFVPDARAAFRELVRVLAPRGLLQIGFSVLASRPATLDFSEAQGFHGYFHLFGRDVAAYLDLPGLGVEMVSVVEPDPVTLAGEEFHFFSKSQAELQSLMRAVGKDADAMTAASASR